MLLVNFIGFAPSWFLKPWIESPPLPPRTHLHGLIFSAWFILLMVQVSLIQRSQVSLHRRLGLASLLLAVAMVISALILLYNRTMLYHEGQRELNSTMMVVWGNLTLLAGFVAFVALGYTNRKKPASHKRFMMLASIAMMPQALGRLGYIPFLRILDGAANNALYALGGIIILLAAMLIHDRSTEGHVLRETKAGTIALLLMIPLGSAVLPQTPLGPLIIESLGSW